VEEPVPNWDFHSSTFFTDAFGNVVSLAAGGAPLANGGIDFGASAIANYAATVNGSSGAWYELRWNVQSVADSGKVFIVGARRAGSPRFLLPPVNIWARQGR